MKHLGVALISASLAATFACACDVAQGPNMEAAQLDTNAEIGARDITAVAAQQAILGAFDRYEVVGGMNGGHGIQQLDDFILSLIQSRDFPYKVDDIAIECGNALYQDTLDRYTTGEDVPLADVRRVWRNTGQSACGFSSFYEALIPLVRRINQKLPPERKIRVLACDPPIDWSKMHSMDDLIPFMDRDASISAVMEKEVLQKHRKALMLFGIHHVQHGDGLSSAVARYEQDGYRNLTFSITPHVGFGNHTTLAPQNDQLEARMARWPAPSLVTLEGTWLAQLDPAYFNAEPSFPGQLGPPGMDGYLYVGLRDSLLNSPSSPQAVLDHDYIAELAQRADSVGLPPGAPARPESVFRLIAEATVFNYEP